MQCLQRRENERLPDPNFHVKNMIHELRVYDAVPGRMPALMKRFEAGTVPLMEKHGFSIVGFWTTMVGESNMKLFCLLAWKSLAEQQEKMAAFAADPEWARVRDSSEVDGPLVANIANTLLTPTSFSPLR